MQKTYVLDTNVLIQSPYALESFEDNQIVLPLSVLEELDSLKGADGERGGNAGRSPVPGAAATEGQSGAGRAPARRRFAAPGGKSCGDSSAQRHGSGCTRQPHPEGVQGSDG